MPRVPRLTTLLALVAFHIGVFSANATVVISFDTDTSGNPITAPSLFSDTTRLSELYAPLGVHFFGPDGPSGRDGGAILDQDSNFGVSPVSGRNFFAFNRGIPMMDGGNPQDPETITFDILATNISIFAAGGQTVKTFHLEGFDAGGVLIASDLMTTQGWAELEIDSLSGIKSVRLSVTIAPSDPSRAFVFDDLSVDFVPEPTTVYLMVVGTAIGSALQLRRKRQ